MSPTAAEVDDLLARSQALREKLEATLEDVSYTTEIPAIRLMRHRRACSVSVMTQRGIRFYWLRQDIVCLVTGHKPHLTKEGTWCERCLEPLDDKARIWDDLEAQASAQR